MPLHRIRIPATLTSSHLAALKLALDDARHAAAPWVLTGSGPRTFCRGMDLSSAADPGETEPIEGALGQFAACLSALRRAPRPTIAVVDGEALGGGVGLLAACDLVLATTAATFALPEALFGFLPGAVLPVLLERMTPQRARLFVLRGSSEGAAWAREVGLVDDVVSTDALEACVERAARGLSRVAPPRVRRLREWMTELSELEVDAAIARGGALTAALLADGGVRVGLQAYLADGTPPWEGA